MNNNRQLLRTQRREQGLCTECGVPSLGFRLCSECRNKYNAFRGGYIKEYRNKRTLNGICQDCSSPKNESVFCDECLKKHNARSNRNKLEKKENNICLDCSNPILDGYRKCHNCLEKDKIKKKNNKELGLCCRCGKESNGEWRCADCVEIYKKRYFEIKVETVNHYGSECNCCGENIFEFLHIDHIDGGGKKHRKQVGNIYKWLKVNGYPSNFQILCANCNRAKYTCGNCPHKGIVRTLTKQQEYKFKLRRTCMEHYGGLFCACCGEDHYEFLEIDHIHNNASKISKLDPSHSKNLDKWLKRNNYPEGYQVLCSNCNFGKGILGHCPHKETEHG